MMIFQEMLDRLHEKGWIKGSLSDLNDSRCLLGSFGEDDGDYYSNEFEAAVVILGQVIWDKYKKRLRNHKEIDEMLDIYKKLSKHYDAAVFIIHSFNDHPDTTFEEIENILLELTRKEPKCEHVPTCSKALV